MKTSIRMIAVALLIGCGAGEQTASFDFPDTLGAQWRLATVETIAVENTPAGVQELGLIEARRGVYEGPGQLTMVVYEMTTQPAAFELVQLWRPSDGQIAFHAGAAFVLLESDNLSAAELNDIAELID